MLFVETDYKNLAQDMHWDFEEDNEVINLPDHPTMILFDACEQKIWTYEYSVEKYSKKDVIHSIVADLIDIMLDYDNSAEFCDDYGLLCHPLIEAIWYNLVISLPDNVANIIEQDKELWEF